MSEMKLYVWTGFSPDYTDGLAFAIAESEEHARELVVRCHGYDTSDWGVLNVFPLTEPVAFSVSGGS